MTRQDIAYKNKILQKKSAPARREIKKVLMRLNKTFIRRVKNQTDPGEIMQTLQATLEDSDFGEKIRDIRQMENQVDFFGGRFYRALERAYNRVK